MTSTIHDIGYRHYDGPRLGRGYVLRSLYVQNLRAAYGLGRPAKAKVMPFLLFGAMLLPAVGSVAALALTKEPNALIRYSAYAVYLQPLIAIFLATQAPVIASRELRFHVVPLYFSRPLGRFDYVLAKYGAFATALFVLLATPVTLLYAGALATREPKKATPGAPPPPQLPGIGEHTVNYLQGLAGCVLFALVLAGIGLVVAAFTPRRGFGVAGVIAVYLVSFTVVTIVQGIAESQSKYRVSGWAGLFTPFYLVDGVQVKFLGAQTSTPQPPPDQFGGVVFAATCAALILAAVGILYARFRKAGVQ
ncbi:MAG TPA: ABC transporter permease [Streptosporangiaceae bacterium]|nr:ABC transporter permease [Streptosporangiaceae bacterium]